MIRPGPKTWYRFTLAALACAGGLALACSGKTADTSGTDGGSGSSSGGSGGSSGGSGSSGGVSNSTACADYFNGVLEGPCELPSTLPASELARDQGRFETVCADALALPGVTLTATALEACVAAVKTDGCNILEATTGPCTFDTGTLAAGASCVTDAQCQQGVCTVDELGADGGEITCGTCLTPPAIGQSCAAGQSCGPNAYCGNETGGPSTCLAITFGAAGAACGGYAECNAGLFCGTNQTCQAPGALGAPCDQDDNCAFPLVCPAVGGSSTCQNPGSAGAPCVEDADCAAGLGCSTTNQCGTVTWANAGQTCGTNARCLVGSCPFNDGTVGGVCPTVIADGQPCDPSSTTATCDTFADCIRGTCVLGYASCP